MLDATLDSTADDAVRFEFQLRNGGGDPVELTFPSGQRIDVVLYDEDVEVWRWSAGRMFTQAIETESIEPGDSVSYEVAWTDPVSGTYTAIATLAASSHDVDARARVSV